MDKIEVKKGVTPGPMGNIIYARSGMGKSTFLGDLIKNAKNGVMFQCGENSLKDLDPEWSKDIPYFPKVLGGGMDMKSMSDGWIYFKDELMKYLMTGDHGFTDIGFDSFDNLICDNLDSFVTLRDYGGNQAKANAYGGAKLKEMYSEVALIIEAFKYLQEKKNISITLTFHGQTINFKDPSEPDYKKWSLAVPAREDYNIRTQFINWSTNTFFGTTEVEVENKKATGGKHILRTKDSAAWEAKTRYRIPDTIDFTYNAFKEAITNSRKVI